MCGDFDYDYIEHDHGADSSEPVAYVIEHRVNGADGPEGEWHQEFAFLFAEIRNDFLDFLNSPELAAVRVRLSAAWEYRKGEVPLSQANSGALESGVEVLLDAIGASTN